MKFNSCLPLADSDLSALVQGVDVDVTLPVGTSKHLKFLTGVKLPYSPKAGSIVCREAVRIEESHSIDGSDAQDLGRSRYPNRADRRSKDE